MRSDRQSSGHCGQQLLVCVCARVRACSVYAAVWGYMHKLCFFAWQHKDCRHKRTHRHVLYKFTHGYCLYTQWLCSHAATETQVTCKHLCYVHVEKTWVVAWRQLSTRPPLGWRTMGGGVGFVHSSRRLHEFFTSILFCIQTGHNTLVLTVHFSSW